MFVIFVDIVFVCVMFNWLFSVYCVEYKFKKVCYCVYVSSVLSRKLIVRRGGYVGRYM